MSEDLEKIQRRILKTIFGYDQSLGMIDLTEKYWRKKTLNDLAPEEKISAKKLPKKLTKTKNTPPTPVPPEKNLYLQYEKTRKNPHPEKRS